MTRAVILAAGEGSRLRPLTNNLPKTLVKLFNRPLLTRQLDVLNRAGINAVSVVAGYCAAAFEAYGTPLIINADYSKTNMVASLHRAHCLFDGEEDVIVSYGDIAYEPNVLRAALDTPGPLVVVVDVGWKTLWQLRMDNPLDDAETMKIDANGCITELGGKPQTLDEIEGQYIGLIKIDKIFAPFFFDLYESWPVNTILDEKPIEMMYMTSYIQRLIDQGIKVQAAKVENGWLEVDTLDDLLRYEYANKNGQLTHIYNTSA